MKAEILLNVKDSYAPLTAYAGGTVLEQVALQVEPVQLGHPQPPQTPPQPFQTHTTSGEGYARINDDNDNEFLYE